MMELKDYKKLYELIFKMSYDVEEFSIIDSLTEEELEKLKWIICMASCLNDVPLRKAKYALMRKHIEFDEIEFLDDHENE